MRDWFLGDVATEEAADKKKTAFSIGDLTLHDRVGDGYRNREEDVSAVDSALSILGLRPREKQEKPDRYITRSLETAIRLFQGDNDLKKDGWLSPGGETEMALNTKLVEKKAEKVTSTQLSLPPRKPDTLLDRKAAILDDSKKAVFHIMQNPDASGKEPLHTIGIFSEVKENEKVIEREAKKAGVDPDFVKAIVHLETTQGWYDRLAAFIDNGATSIDKSVSVVSGNKYNLNISNHRFYKSIRPMNVHAEEWKDLGYSRKDLEAPDKNVQAGVALIGKIQKRMPDASPEEIASVYNSLGVRKVSDYGMRVKKLMEEKPWRK